MHEAPQVANLEIHPGEQIMSVAGGGGGYGEPCHRHVDAVIEDLLEGRISEKAAHEVYGVVATNGIIDVVATARARRQLVRSDAADRP